MTTSSNKIEKNIYLNQENSLLTKYGMSILNTPFVFEEDINLGLSERYLVVEKLLEAYELAKANVESGNITGRGFATNVCTQDYYWSIGTNFNNTRNDISSICGERTAILSAYNDSLMRFSKNPRFKFDFKIRYLCMASNIDLDKITTMIAPCEDCLSWLNTNRYFNFNTLIFSFERDINNQLVVRASRLVSFLPYKLLTTSVKINSDKKIKYTQQAVRILEQNKKLKDKIMQVFKKSYEAYFENSYTSISGQNISCSILVGDEIITSSKIDWTKRWNIEPLEFCCAKAIEKYSTDIKIDIISYFGDDCSKNQFKTFNDGLVSIKSLGRVRQKYATSDTLLIVNTPDSILVMTLGEYLPKKFVQGYKII